MALRKVHDGPATAPSFVAVRFTPLPPPHPGRKQDDGAQEVSWLPALTLSSAFPNAAGDFRRNFSGVSDDRSPVTVAGAAAVSNRVP